MIREAVAYVYYVGYLDIKHSSYGHEPHLHPSHQLHFFTPSHLRNLGQQFTNSSVGFAGMKIPTRRSQDWVLTL